MERGRQGSGSRKTLRLDHAHTGFYAEGACAASRRRDWRLAACLGDSLFESKSGCEQRRLGRTSHLSDAMASSPPPIDEIFLAALGKPTPQERIAFLDGVCGSDAELRGRLERLLAVHTQSQDFIAQGPVVLNETVVSVGEGTGEPQKMVGVVIGGRYKLLEEIATGGMGSVWIAEQSQPVRRRVAIKLIKPGMDSRQVLSRFEAERQALALMDHPNIAKVLDGGVTDQAHPFFVMEYVKGVPITDFCDQAKVTLEGRLKLFVKVCQAVQHAHQKGIIHRDLKPSNILVCLYDGHPIPKVIDFGLAKAMHQPLTEHTLYTAHGFMIGTPLYMSPEQAEFNNLDIDTRSDIYSLGVILYELLTGTTPLDRQRIKSAAWPEAVRLIKEEEPSKPSTKLSVSHSLPTVAAQRSLEPAQLSRAVRGDLDWIVMKALDKERSRRYETANGLARDIERYLADDVVEARPPSASYRLRKLVRRNQGLVVAVGLIALALIGGIAGTTWGMIRAFDARRAEAERAEGERLAKLEAEAQKTRAIAAATAEKAANEQAQKRLAQIQKGNEVITSIFSDLDIRKVKKTGPLEQVLAERLVKAAGQLEGEAVGDPLVVAGLQERLGLSLLNLGHPERAIPLFQKAADTRRSKLGADHPDTLDSSHNLAESYLAAGKLDLALPLLIETVRLRKARLGADSADTLESTNDLALCYEYTGKLDVALPLFEETLKLARAKLGPEHSTTLTCTNNLAYAYGHAGKLNLALPLYEEAVRIAKFKLGADHPDTLTCMNNLATGYKAAGKLTLALPLLEDTLKLMKANLGADHPNTLTSMNNLASAYRDAGKWDLALPLYEETVKLKQAKLGGDHPDTLVSMNNLASGYQAAGKLDLAVPLFEETLKLRTTKLGAGHPDTLASSQNLADACLSAAAQAAWFGRDKEYAETCRRALELAKSSNDPITLDRVARACSLRSDGDAARLADSLNLARRAVELGKGRPSLPSFQMTLGMSEFRNGHLAEADTALVAAMNAGKDASPLWATAAFYRAMNLFRQGKSDEARKLATEATAKIKPVPRDQPNPGRHDELVPWMAYKEAKELLKLDSISTAAGPVGK
jgi:tetratricopeptide (TPR) repeat protein/tRNA A-37 threonylcarbamoyl transferase component Bud32